MNNFRLFRQELAGLILVSLACCQADSPNDEASDPVHFRISVDGMSGEPRAHSAEYSFMESALGSGQAERKFGVVADVSEPGATTGEVSRISLSLYYAGDDPLTGRFELVGDSQMIFQIGDDEFNARTGAVILDRMDTSVGGSFDVTTDGPNARRFTGRFDGPIRNFCAYMAPNGTNGMTNLDGSPVLVTDWKLESEFCKKYRIQGS